MPPPTGRTPAERDELETLLDETPSVSGLSQDDRVGMVQSARALDLPPGRTAVLPAAADLAALVAAGHVRAGEHDARRGSLITTNADADEQLEARTSSRLWTVPCTPGLALLFPGPAVAPPAAGGAPLDGVHADEDYVPLLAPPAPPEPPADPDLDDDAVDRRLLVGVALLAVVIAIGALLLTVSTLREQSRPWVELPDASIVVTATQGPVAVTLDGAATSLATGEAVTATLGDLVEVPADAGADSDVRGWVDGSAVPGHRRVGRAGEPNRHQARAAGGRPGPRSRAPGRCSPPDDDLPGRPARRAGRVPPREEPRPGHVRCRRRRRPGRVRARPGRRRGQ